MPPKKASKKKYSKANMPVTKRAIRKRPPGIPKLTDDLYSIEIYLQYFKLRSDSWIKILQLFEDIKSSVIDDYDLENTLTSTSSINFLLTPTLDISIIRTGSSVIIRFEEGWKPTVKVSNKDITIGLPKKVALPGLMLYAIYQGYDTYLDTQMKRIDLQLKQVELEEKLDKRSTTENPKKALDSAKKFVDYILTDQDMKFVRVNNFVIKK